MLTPEEATDLKAIGIELGATFEADTGKYSLRPYAAKGWSSPTDLMEHIVNLAKSGNHICRRALQTITESYRS